MSIIGPRASEWDAVNTFLSDEIWKGNRDYIVISV